MRAQPVFEQVNDAASCSSRFHHQVDGAGRLDQQRAGGIHGHCLFIALKFPWLHSAPPKAHAQAIVLKQLTWMFGAPAFVEVGRRSSSSETLHPGANRHRNHVLLKTFFIADTGIAAGGQHVDEALFRNNFQLYFGISGQESRHDGR